MTPTEIKNLIQSQLKNASIDIQGDDGRHFTAIVISNDFAGKNRVERQRMVYDTLGTQIANGTLHAISIKTLTEEEAKKS